MLHDAGVRLGVVHDHVVPGDQGVDDGDHALVAVVEQVGRLFLLEPGEFLFQFTVQLCLSRHHPRAHGVGHTPIGRGLGIRLAYFRVVG